MTLRPHLDTLHFWFAFWALLFCVPFLPGASCQEAKAIAADLTPLGSCLFNQLLTGQLPDPVDDMLACGGATESSIANFIATIESPPAVDAGPPVLSAAIAPTMNATLANLFHARIAAAKMSLAARRVRRFGLGEAGAEGG